MAHDTDVQPCTVDAHTLSCIHELTHRHTDSRCTYSLSLAYMNSHTDTPTVDAAGSHRTELVYGCHRGRDCQVALYLSYTYPSNPQRQRVPGTVVALHLSYTYLSNPQRQRVPGTVVAFELGQVLSKGRCRHAILTLTLSLSLTLSLTHGIVTPLTPF